jgi:hypothetical protein
MLIEDEKISSDDEHDFYKRGNASLMKDANREPKKLSTKKWAQSLPRGGQCI